MKQFRGNIFECIDEAVRYVTNNIRWRAEIRGMERIETPEIPVEAFREIIVNSFAHMEVNPSSSNEIYITPTRVHVYNPGPLVPGTDPKMFADGTQGSMIRNPLIATVLYYNKTIDAFGTGFERVFRLCGEENCRYSSNPFGFTFEFLRTGGPSYELTNDADPEAELTDVEKNVLRILESPRRHSKSAIAERIGCSQSTVQRAIKRLTELGKVRRVGSNKTGRWVVVR
jgi:ATP-dependent DNA helicase RecG